MPTHLIVVSGASGTIGARLMQDLAQLPSDIEIVALVHSDDGRKRLTGSLSPRLARRIRTELADVTRPDMLEALGRAIRTTVPVVGVHCAADVSWDKPLEEMRELNVQGSINFCRLIAAASPRGRIIYLSTAYTRAYDWHYRNGYEESKALGERVIRNMFAHVPISVFSCSLVVGDSRTGEITRHHGLYPVMRFLAAGPPFLVGNKEGRLDIVPIEWVVHELKCLIVEQLEQKPPRDLVAAAGDRRIRFIDAVRLIEQRINRFREANGLRANNPVPILRVRQWEFLRRALKAWQPSSVPLTEFQYFERLLQVYRAYTESDRVREPLGIATPAPDPHRFLPIVVDRWLEEKATSIVPRLTGAAPVEERRHV